MYLTLPQQLPGPQSPHPQEQQSALRIPDPFSGSKLGTMAPLTVAGLQAEDKSSYYCHSYDTSVKPVWLRSPDPKLSEDTNLLALIACS